MIMNDSSQKIDTGSNDDKYESRSISDITIERREKGSSVKPPIGVYRTASISSIKKQERINLRYDNDKESLKKIYIQANSIISNATTNSKH